MEFSYTINGGAPLRKLYQTAVSSTAIGQPWLIPAADTAGLAIGTTTSAADMVGVNLNSATYVTAQTTDGTSTQRRLDLIVNPDAVWRMKLSGGATEDTALALQTVTTASATGTAITTGTTWTGTEFDEGVVWGYEGANAGAYRKITSTSSTAGTVTVAFDRDTAVGDTFLRAPYWPIQGLTIQLTTLLTQADASIAVGTGAQFKTVELELRDITDSGRTNSYVLAVATDHVFGFRPT